MKDDRDYEGDDEYDEDDKPYGKRRRPDDRLRRRDDDWFGMDMDDEFDRIRRRMDRLMGEILSGRDMRMEGPFVYGFSMRTGPDGRPQFREFGNTTPPALSEDSKVLEREPLTDIIESIDSVSITVEIPGVNKDDIDLGVNDDSLTINVDSRDRKYFKEMPLPCKVVPDTVKATYKNGVLDIVIRKGEVKKKERKVKIE